MKTTTTRPFNSWTSLEHKTWRILASRQLEQMKHHGSRRWLAGWDQLHLPVEHIPDFEKVDATLSSKAGWSLCPTDTVFADGQLWFETLRKREFLITNYIRSANSIDYTPMPDIFHDSFGHLPLLMDPMLSRIIDSFSKVMLNCDRTTRTKLGHIWWYTIEFGLIIEDGSPKILGAGIASSFAETQKIFAGETNVVPFDATIVSNTDERHHELHSTVFVLRSLEELEAVITPYASKLSLSI